MRGHLNSRNDLSAEYLRTIFAYDPESGILTRRATGRIATQKASQGRLRVTIGNTRYLAHRIIWVIVTGAWPEYEVDHRDNNPSNNRWENLRHATHAQNLCNRFAPRHNTSGYKGVSWSVPNKGWIGRITKGGRVYHLGTFDTKEAAYAARLEAEKRLFGDFGKA